MEKTYFITKEQYLAVKQAWAARSNHSAADIIIYNALRSKPLRNGFVERLKNIQGNDTWYSYKEALKNAQRQCSTTNPWAQYGAGNASYERGEERIKATKSAFQKAFGIDIPEGFMDQLKDA